MTNEVSIKLNGQREISNLFKALPKIAKGKVLKKGLRKGARPIIKSARSKVPRFDFGNKKDSTTLRKSIGVVIRKGKRHKDHYAVIGPRVGGANDGWFAHWIEYGTLSKRSKPLVQKRSEAARAAAARGLGFRKSPFLRPALFQQGLRATKIILTEILSGIKAHWDKENK
ncbi:MAG: HK97 gp10 family phage protein [Candidatus Anammoxibacter sp.]